MGRILDASMFTSAKWHDAQLITARNAVRCAHNSRTLMAQAHDIGIKPIVWRAKDTFRQGELLSNYPNLQQIVHDMHDSKTGNLSFEFVYP